MSNDQDTSGSYPINRRAALSDRWHRFTIIRWVGFGASFPCIITGLAVLFSAKDLKEKAIGILLLMMAFALLSVATHMQKKLRNLKLEIDFLAAIEETQPKRRPRHLKLV